MSSHPVQSNCCFSCDRIKQIEPLFPVTTTARPAPKKNSSKFVARKQPPIRPSVAKNRNSIRNSKTIEPCESFVKKPSLNKGSHPFDYMHNQCEEKCPVIQDLQSSSSKDKLAAQGSACSLNMANPRSERNMKNFLHDNPELEESKIKKTASFASIMDCVGSNSEVWILQCPKGFDPKTIMETELGSLHKDKSCKVDLTTKCFNSKISLACLTPEKASEYEAVCDRVKILKPVGKITIVQKSNLPKKSSSVRLPDPIKIEPKSDADDCSDDEDDDSCLAPITSKKVKTKINDQKFTIETTVTVENCGGNRKKNRKSCGGDSCLPLVPPEPIVPKKKQRKNQSDDEDTSWLNC